MTGLKLDDYKKPRVAIGAFEGSDPLCRCIAELVGIIPASLTLFVLTPGEADREELKKICAMRLPAPVRKQVLLVSAGLADSSGSEQPSDNTGLAVNHLMPSMVSDYAGWLDQRSAQHLQDILAASGFLLFIQVSNASQEIASFNTLSQYCSGAIQLHDLPV